MNPNRPAVKRHASIRLAPLSLFLAAAALLFFGACSNKNFTVKNHVPAEGEPGWGVFAKQKIYTSRKDGQVLRIDTIFTEEYAAENGAQSQIEFYREGQPWMFEVKSSAESAAATGLDIRREYRDESGRIAKIEIMMTDESKWLFAGDLMETFRMFPPMKLKNFAAVNAPVADIPGMARLANAGKIEPVSEEQIALVRTWSEQRSAAGMAGDFDAAVTVEEEGVPYTLLFNSQKREAVESQKDFLVFYNYIGTAGGKPLFLMIGYYNNP